jgi:hypothetical protein
MIQADDYDCEKDFIQEEAAQISLKVLPLIS